MTDMKQVPENLKELEQKAAFKSVYKKHTVEQLQELLLEANTYYLSDDNKAALVWRYMDAKGMAFDEVVTEDAPASDNDQPETTPDVPAIEAEEDVPAIEADHIAIENTGAFNFLETATSTLVRAKQVTKIYPTARVTKVQILRNIEQYNYTRGEVLNIVN